MTDEMNEIESASPLAEEDSEKEIDRPAPVAETLPRPDSRGEDYVSRPDARHVNEVPLPSKDEDVVFATNASDAFDMIISYVAGDKTNRGNAVRRAALLLRGRIQELEDDEDESAEPLETKPSTEATTFTDRHEQREMKMNALMKIVDWITSP